MFIQLNCGVYFQTVRIHVRDLILWNNICSNLVRSSTFYWSLHEPRSPPAWISYIWHTYFIPCCDVNMWLLLKNRLLTKDRMLNFGMNVDGNCTLCHGHLETARHLFKDCHYIQAMFPALQWPITRDRNDLIEERLIVGNISKVEKWATYLIYSVLAYHIWKERNTRIHNTG